MAYHVEKGSGDIVIDGWEHGVAPSPHKGIANIQCANISTETGEVMCNYNRVVQLQSSTATFTVTYKTTNTLTSSSATFPYAGTWITVSGYSGSGLANGDYYVLSNAAGVIQLGTTFNGTAVTGYTAGSGTFVIKTNFATGVQAATEKYVSDNVGTVQYRYYILDINGVLWVQDTNVSLTGGTWFAPNEALGGASQVAAGLAVAYGYVNIFLGAQIFTQKTSVFGYNASFGVGYDIGYEGGTNGGLLNTIDGNYNSHFAILSRSAQGIVACDTSFLALIQPASNSSSGGSNSWGAGTFTASSHTCTVSVLSGGDFPPIGSTITFFTNQNGTLYSGVSAGDVYYVIATNWSPAAKTFEVSSSYGGSAVSFSGGSGTQYFNTFNPSLAATYVFSPQALTLDSTEIAQSLCEIGNQIVIGTQSNFIYFWTPGSNTPTGVQTPTSGIPLPESNTAYMVNVNNFAYIFAGQKGNIYLTNGSAVVPVLTVPDYTAGIAGTPTSYIEPYFIWGGAAFIRGRIFFSIQDQTGSKTGNCGGIWSFIPTQAAFPQQDVGVSLRLETQSSYGTYSGVSPIILTSANQLANGPQYWTAWYSSVGTTTYGIDFSGTSPYTGGQTVIESDIIPFGQILGAQKGTPNNIEFKLAAPLAANESVAINFRANSTDAWTSAGTIVYETGSGVGQVVGNISPHQIENVYWLQFQIILTSTASSPSFVRFVELRVRPK